MSEAPKSSPENSKKASAVEAAAVKKKSRNNSLLRCLKRARDIYVNTFCGCAGAGGGSPRGGGFTAGVAVLMPRARSRSAFGQSSGLGENDLIDLVRASSKRNAAAPAPAPAVVPRSQSLAPAIGRIDEERSTEFEEDVKPGIGSRSQSCTVVAGGRMLGGRPCNLHQKESG
ncbi:hypothetical protein KSP40_PGU020671 [Platanthera guangdongensis]|uniref:Uncharacterized protein n=1 Tax=Platanthera guangdongensis TaxID=2320717 RepID=A0ABR2MES4_9ASPA